MTMTTGNKARVVKRQHKKPCHDCPWRRNALRGWLGTNSAEDWVTLAHSEAMVECHTRRFEPAHSIVQCAGNAIYRANVLKSPRYPEVLRLPADHSAVFSTPTQFLEYHNASITQPATEQDESTQRTDWALHRKVWPLRVE